MRRVFAIKFSGLGRLVWVKLNSRILSSIRQRVVTQCGTGLQSGAQACVSALWVRAVSSVVEHYLDMVGVTGSNPVPPTNKINRLRNL